MESRDTLLIELSFLLLSLFCAGLVYAGLRKVLPHTSFPPRRQKRILFSYVAILLLWISILAVLSLSGWLGNFDSIPPRMFIVLAVPLCTILFITFSTGMNEILRCTPGHWLILIQTFRIPVEVLLWWMFISNLLPLMMTFEGRNLDILSGLLALPAAYVMARNSGLKKMTGIAYNIVGLLFLINIVVIAVLSLPTPFRVFTEGPSNAVMATFPYVLLPGILVPLAYSMHFFSLRKLLATKPSALPETNRSAQVHPV
ncbi:MAG: hypothetical protein WD077_02715 [Bacteroidia bacterium]